MVVRAFASHQCGLCSIPAWCHVWVEFVVGSRLAPRLVSSLHKNQHPQIAIRPGKRTRMKTS